MKKSKKPKRLTRAELEKKLELCEKFCTHAEYPRYIALLWCCRNLVTDIEKLTDYYNGGKNRELPDTLTLERWKDAAQKAECKALGVPELLLAEERKRLAR